MTPDLITYIAAQLRQRGYVVIGKDELGEIWQGNESHPDRERLIRDFAAEIKAKVARWDERGALFKRLKGLRSEGN